MLSMFVFSKEKMQVRVFVNETHLDQMLVSQVYQRMSGNDYFGKKGGKEVHSRRENWNSC